MTTFAPLMGLPTWVGNVGLLIMGTFYLLLWSSIVASIFNICHKLTLAPSHFLYSFLTLSLIWKALPKSRELFWLRTVPWIMCSGWFSCITDYVFLAVSQKNVPGDDEFTFSPICLSPKCNKKCFCRVVDSILPLYSGLKKTWQFLQTHTYLVTRRQGISSVWCDPLRVVPQAGLPRSWVGNCLGWEGPPRMDWAPIYQNDPTLVCVCMQVAVVYGCVCTK